MKKLLDILLSVKPSGDGDVMKQYLLYISVDLNLNEHSNNYLLFNYVNFLLFAPSHMSLQRQLV